MTVKSTDVPSAFQYYIKSDKLYKITYDTSENAGTPQIKSSHKVDFIYNISDTNSNYLTVDSINARSITAATINATDVINAPDVKANTLDTKEIIMPVNNDSNNPVTITAIADEDEPPSLNLLDN